MRCLPISQPNEPIYYDTFHSNRNSSCKTLDTRNVIFIKTFFLFHSFFFCKTHTRTGEFMIMTSFMCFNMRSNVICCTPAAARQPHILMMMPGDEMTKCCGIDANWMPFKQTNNIFVFRIMKRNVDLMSMRRRSFLGFFSSFSARHVQALAWRTSCLSMKKQKAAKSVRIPFWLCKFAVLDQKKKRKVKQGKDGERKLLLVSCNTNFECSADYLP